MADINHVVLVGRLVRDAQLKYANNGLAICEFTIAINYRRKQGDDWVDEANFFDVTLFGRQGEAIQRYLTQGKQVGIDGRLHQDRWQNQEGQNRTKVSVIANNAMLLGSRDGGGQSDGSGSGDRSDFSGSGNREQNSGGTARGDGSGIDNFPDDIPF